MAGIMSLSLFLFSSYTGNDPSMRTLSGSVSNNYLQLSTVFDYAFDNDFTEVFKSGKQIPLYYRVEVRSAGGIVFQKTYYNSVSYDNMKGSYKVYQSGIGQSFELGSHNAVIAAMSSLACSIPIERKWGTATVALEAWLPTVEFPQIKRKVDLMVLWKYRRPTTKGTFNLRLST